MNKVSDSYPSRTISLYSSLIIIFSSVWSDIIGIKLLSVESVYYFIYISVYLDNLWGLKLKKSSSSRNIYTTSFVPLGFTIELVKYLGFLYKYNLRRNYPELNRKVSIYY